MPAGAVGGQGREEETTRQRSNSFARRRQGKRFFLAFLRLYCARSIRQSVWSRLGQAASHVTCQVQRVELAVMLRKEEGVG